MRVTKISFLKRDYGYAAFDQIPVQKNERSLCPKIEYITISKKIE